MVVTVENIKICMKEAFDLLLGLKFELAAQAFKEILAFDEKTHTLSFDDLILLKEGCGIALLNNPATQEEGLELHWCVYRELSVGYGKYHEDTLAALHSLGCAYRTCSMISEACGIFAYEIALLEKQNLQEELEEAQKAYKEIICLLR